MDAVPVGLRDRDLAREWCAEFPHQPRHENWLVDFEWVVAWGESMGRRMRRELVWLRDARSEYFEPILAMYNTGYYPYRYRYQGSVFWRFERCQAVLTQDWSADWVRRLGSPAWSFGVEHGPSDALLRRRPTGGECRGTFRRYVEAFHGLRHAERLALLSGELRD